MIFCKFPILNSLLCKIIFFELPKYSSNFSDVKHNQKTQKLDNSFEK